MNDTFTRLLYGGFIMLSGCAFFSKGDLASRRYLSPELPVSTSRGNPEQPTGELRLGRVTSSAYLQEKIVFRESRYEIGFYEDRRWTEQPEAYLRRAVTRVLFEEGALRRVKTGGTPSLDVELQRFEEVKSPRHIGVVQIGYELSDERASIVQRTLIVERPIVSGAKGEEAAAAAQALGEALREAVDTLATQVVNELPKSRAGSEDTTGSPRIKNES